MSEETVVYWIRHPSHTDIMSQGYVGVSNDFEKRMIQHERSKNTYPINRAINKHGFDALTKEVIFTYPTREDALDKEAELRPQPNIGLNCAEGGVAGCGSEWYKVPENAERHSKACSDWQMNRTSQERSASSKKASETIGEEGRKAANKKAKETLGEEGRSAASKKGRANMGPIRCSAAVSKGHQTRRNNKEVKAILLHTIAWMALYHATSQPQA